MIEQQLWVFGLEELESRELEELLSKHEYVQEVEVRSSHDNIVPGVIYASAEYVEFLLRFLTKQAAEALAKEAARGVLEEGWEQIKKQIITWKDLRNRESGRERIHLSFGRDGELYTNGQDSE